MPETAIKKQLNGAKRSACSILKKAGYEIERASNSIYCVVAMRGSEYRFIKIGLDSILASPWFQKEIKKFERLPCPDPRILKKEAWIREASDRAFKLYVFENNKWIDEDFNPTDIFNFLA